MAHFCKLDENDIVVQTIVIANAALLDENGIEQEALGIELCKSLFGADANYVQTSYNALFGVNNLTKEKAFRGHYGQEGMKYDREKDEFIHINGFNYPRWNFEKQDWEIPEE